MGFMLIEISQMQRLMVFLGHPVYGLSVVLFTILVFSGLGSTTVGAGLPEPRAVIARVAAPPAFCMGMMFPLGLSIWRRHERLLPFFWSANGITSMLASVLGMALSIEFGIARAYARGVVFYAVCCLMIALGGRAGRVVTSAARPAEKPELPRLDEAVAAAAS